MKIFYTRSNKKVPNGFTFRNARFFDTPEPGVTEIHLDGHYPDIEAAYKAADKSIKVIQGGPDAARKLAPATPAETK
jgi:hypothetical protein